MSNTLPPISEALAKSFGNSFEDATLAEKLILMEAISSLMRGTVRDFSDALDAAIIEDEQSERIAKTRVDEDFENPNEALRLMAILHVGIVEDYAVLAARR